MPHINSTEFLALIAKNDCCILFETRAPVGQIKKDLISITTSDGRALGLGTQSGFSSGQLELPREIFNDFLAARLIEQDRREDSEGRIFFRITADGRARGLSY